MKSQFESVLVRKLWKANGTVHCLLYNATRIIVRNADNIELACLKKEEDRKGEKHFGRFAAFWFGIFGTFVMLFHATISESCWL